MQKNDVAKLNKFYQILLKGYLRSLFHFGLGGSLLSSINTFSKTQELFFKFRKNKKHIRKPL